MCYTIYIMQNLQLLTLSNRVMGLIYQTIDTLSFWPWPFTIISFFTFQPGDEQYLPDTHINSVTNNCSSTYCFHDAAVEITSTVQIKDILESFKGESVVFMVEISHSDFPDANLNWTSNIIGLYFFNLLYLTVSMGHSIYNAYVMGNHV